MWSEDGFVGWWGPHGCQGPAGWRDSTCGVVGDSNGMGNFIMQEINQMTKYMKTMKDRLTGGRKLQECNWMNSRNKL